MATMIGERASLLRYTYIAPLVTNTRWFKYDRDGLCVNKSQFVPVIFEPPCIMSLKSVLPIAGFSV